MVQSMLLQLLPSRGQPVWAGRGCQQWLPRGDQHGSELQGRREEGGLGGEYRGLNVWELETSQTGRTREEGEGHGRQAWMVRLAGGRFPSASNATVKNLDFSPGEEMGLEGA